MTSARHRLNLLAVPLMLLMAVAVVDAIASRVLTPSNEFNALPRAEVYVSGLLEEPVLGGQRADGSAGKAYDPNLLLSTSGDTEGLEINFEEVVGTMWRARIFVAPDALPGRRVFWVHERLVQPGTDAPPTVLTVFENEGAFRASFHSLFLRYLGIKAWWVALGLLPVSIGLLAASYMISGREEEQLKRRGIGPIYKLARRGGEWEVVFGLGSAQGVQTGDTLRLLDARLNRVAEVVALEVRPEFSATLVDGRLPIKPDFHVARMDDPPC